MNTLIKFNSGVMGAAMALALLTTGCNGAQEASPEAEQPKEVTLDSTEEKVTYIVGYNMAKQAKANGLDFNKDVMMQAIADVKADKEPRIAQAEQQQIMMAFQEEQQAARDAERKAEGETNKKESEAFLAENAERGEVTVTDSGLQYEVLQEGEEGAASPSAEDTVKVHYHGTLVDGEVFDSSVERDQPATFAANRVIKGWTEALQLMSVGDKYKLYIPPELAYGESGAGGKIGPNEALIFEVELLGVNPGGEQDAEGGDSAETE